MLLDESFSKWVVQCWYQHIILYKQNSSPGYTSFMCIEVDALHYLRLIYSIEFWVGGSIIDSLKEVVVR